MEKEWGGGEASALGGGEGRGEGEDGDCAEGNC